MFKRKKKSKKVNFLLENNHYRNLHLYLYLVTILVVVSFYFLILFMFSESNIFITSLISILIGFYMVFNKDRIVKIISDKIHENSVKNIKKENKDGLKKTIRKIVAKPKRNIKLSIGGKDTFKDRLNDLKNKFNPNKKKKSEEYIEFK